MTRINTWINKRDPANVPFDPISHALFVLNKAALVYVLLPMFIIIGLFWLFG